MTDSQSNIDLKKRLSELENENVQLKQQLYHQYWMGEIVPLHLDIELLNLITVKELQEILNFFYELYNVPVSFLNPKGDIIATAGQRDVCLNFKELFSEGHENCTKSHRKLAAYTGKADPVIHKCLNGVNEAAIPIVIRGNHLGALSFGQFFFNDEEVNWDFHQRQSEKFTIDPKGYLDHLKNIPIVERSLIVKMLSFGRWIFHRLLEGSYLIFQEKRPFLETNCDGGKTVENNNQLLKKVVEKVPCPICIYDYNGNSIFVNEKYQRYFPDITIQNSGGKASRDQEFMKIFQEVVKDNISIHNVVQLSENGESLEIKEKLIPILDEKGDVMKVLSILLDETHGVKEKSELHFSQQPFKGVFENAIVGILFIEKNGEILLCNNAAQKIIGCSDQEINKKHIQDIITGNDFTREREEVSSIVNGDKDFYRIEKRFIRRDRSSIWVDLSISVYRNNKGMPEYYVAFFVDIDQKKKVELALSKSEEQYRSVVSSMNEGVLLTMANGDIVTYNAAAERILGVNFSRIYGHIPTHPAWEAIYEDGSAFPPEKHPSIMTLSTGKSQSNVIMGVRKKDHSISWISINSEPLWNEEDTMPFAVVTSFTDITHQKEVENVLRQSNVTKDRFFSIIAHDLKDPFNAILGFSKYLLESVDYENYSQTKELANLVHESASRAYDLLINLLEWSRLQANRVVFTPEKLMLHQVAQNVINVLIQVAAKKKIQLNLEIDENLVIDADLNMLEAILRNLISNAIKYSFQDQQVVVKADANEKGVLVSVVDFGVGITGEEKLRIFKFSNNTSKEGTAHERGTGLGLVLCKEFVDLHKGNLEVKPNGYKGTVFSFFIPNSIY